MKYLSLDEIKQITVTNQNEVMNFYIAAANGQIDIVKQFLESLSEEEINKQDSNGTTALHYACLNKQTKVINLMLSCAKVNPNVTDANYNTPLTESTRMLLVNVVELLLANPQVNVNYKNTNGNTCLHIAICASNVTIMKLLLSRPDIDINVTNHDGIEAFRFLFEPDNVELLKVFLDLKPIPISWSDSDGNSILHIAYREGDILTIKEMKKHYDVIMLRDNLFINNNSGLSPSQLAISLGKQDLVYYAKTPINHGITSRIIYYITNLFN